MEELSQSDLEVEGVKLHSINLGLEMDESKLQQEDYKTNSKVFDEKLNQIVLNVDGGEAVELFSYVLFSLCGENEYMDNSDSGVGGNFSFDSRHAYGVPKSDMKLISLLQKAMKRIIRRVSVGCMRFYRDTTELAKGSRFIFDPGGGISYSLSIIRDNIEFSKKTYTYAMLEQIGQLEVLLDTNQKQIEDLQEKLCAADNDRQRTLSDAVAEVSGLRTEKIKLESSLLEAHAKVKLYEIELRSLKLEYGKKVQGLVDLLAASKQSEEMSMSDIEYIQRQGEAAKSSAEIFKALEIELELMLKAFDYEKQQVIEEESILRIELKKIGHLQDEILVLKSYFAYANFKRKKFEELLQSLSEECEGLKKVKVEYMEKISNMQKAFHDGENDRCSRMALEEKLLRMEGDLTLKEATYALEVDNLLDKSLLQEWHTTLKDCKRSCYNLDIGRLFHKKISKSLPSKAPLGLISTKEEKKRPTLLYFIQNR